MINGFWHIAQVGNWKLIVPMQWKKLKASGLLDATEKLYVVMVGTDDPDRHAGELPEEIVSHPKVILQTRPTRYDFEFPTLILMQKVARETEGNHPFYYIHTKGAMTASTEAYAEGALPEHKNPAYWWGQYMEYYIIERWQRCVETLNSGFDICGVEWRLAPLPHFSGNMWWATTEYLRECHDGQLWWDKYRTDRIMAEMYVGSGDPHFHCFKNTWENLYLYPVTPDQWS